MDIENEQLMMMGCPFFYGRKYYGSNKTYIITHEQGKDAGEVSEGQNGL